MHSRKMGVGLAGFKWGKPKADFTAVQWIWPRRSLLQKRRIWDGCRGNEWIRFHEWLSRRAPDSPPVASCGWGNEYSGCLKEETGYTVIIKQLIAKLHTGMEIHHDEIIY